MTHFIYTQLEPILPDCSAEVRKFIVTSEDLEHEFSGPMSEADARLLASALNGCQMIVNRWERGRLDEAARVCAAVVADATGREA